MSVTASLNHDRFLFVVINPMWVLFDQLYGQSVIKNLMLAPVVPLPSH